MNSKEQYAVSKNKVKRIDELLEIVSEERTKGKKCIFANGCFDILHVGHVRYLREARELGDILIVAINSDLSVRRIKGEGRPYTPEKERVEIISSIEYVDYIILFDEPDVSQLLLAIKPDIQCKGTDYSEETGPEKDVVLSYGGRVSITGDPKDRSSTEIIGKISNG